MKEKDRDRNPRRWTRKGGGVVVVVVGGVGRRNVHP